MGIKYHIFKSGGEIPPARISRRAKNPEDDRLTRSEMDKRLVDEGWGTSFRDEQQRDYCKFLEKGIREGYNCGGRVNLRAGQIHRLMKQFGKEDG